MGWRNGSGPAEGAYTGWVPDALVPVEWAPAWAPYPMAVPAGQNRIVWVDVLVPRGQAPGGYRGQVTVRAGDALLAEVPVELRVGAPVMPARPVATMLFWNNGQTQQRMGAGAVRATERHFWQLLHRHRVTPMHDADDVADARRRLPALHGTLYTPAQGYDGPAVGLGDDVVSMGTYGRFGAPDAGDLRTVRDIAALLADEGLLAEVDAFVYAVDEQCGHAWGRGWVDLMEGSDDPNLEHVSVGWTCSDPVARQAVDLVIKWAGFYDPAEQVDGKDVWIYNGSQPFTGTFFTDVEAVSMVALGWIQAMHDIPRWFQWQSNFWIDGNNGGRGAYDPFVQPETFHNQHGESANGDGVLVYPGRQIQ